MAVAGGRVAGLGGGEAHDAQRRAVEAFLRAAVLARAWHLHDERLSTVGPAAVTAVAAKNQGAGDSRAAGARRQFAPHHLPVTAAGRTATDARVATGSAEDQPLQLAQSPGASQYHAAKAARSGDGEPITGRGGNAPSLAGQGCRTSPVPVY